MIEEQIQRASLLIEQNRFIDAQKILISILEGSPDNIEVLVLLCETNLQQNKLDEAEDLINNAIRLSPDTAVLYTVKSRVLMEAERYSEAEVWLEEAISLDPEDADNYAFLGSIKFARKKFDEALDLSNQALSLDAQNIIALNFRSSALLKLGQKEASFETIEDALQEDPNNAYTHANHGWGLLEKGEHEKALEHFKQALQNDPNLEHAQSGMGEAIKSKYTLYRWFLKYCFWIGNMTKKYQWGVIIGFYFLVKMLKLIVKKVPSTESFLLPVIVVLALIAFSTWVINPISNLFLRLNKYGKYLLNKNEIRSSNFVGLSALFLVVSTFLFFITSNEVWLVPAVFGFTMMIPLSSMFERNKMLLIYGIVLAFLGSVAILKSFMAGKIDFSYSTMAYLIGFVAYGWIANFIGIKESNI